jgi:hypothetical protein
MSDDEKRAAFRATLRALPGYPWLPCPICAREGFRNARGSCDHTAAERAQATLPGLVLHEPDGFINVN